MLYQEHTFIVLRRVITVQKYISKLHINQCQKVVGSNLNRKVKFSEIFVIIFLKTSLDDLNTKRLWNP